MLTERWTDERLDRLAELVEEITENVKKNAEAIEKLTDGVKGNTEAIKKLTDEARETSIKFGTYQQSTQWVVQLAFSLIASATITVIVTAILKR